MKAVLRITSKIARTSVGALALFAALFLCAACALPTYASPFSINGKPPRSAVITVGDHPVPAWIPESPMLRSRMGIVAVLEGSAIRELEATLASADAAGSNSPPLPPGTLTLPMPELVPLLNPTVTHTIHLDPPGSATSKPTPVQITRYNDDVFFAARAADPKVQERLDTTRWLALAHLSASSLDPHDPLDPALYPPGQVIALTQPYTPSPFTMDRDGLGDRLNGRRPTTITPADRDLANEQFFLRAPQTPEPSDTVCNPRGLLLWVSASPSGDPPETLFEAADALNLVIVSPANCGNDRDVSNRLQVTLDAVATALDRIPIDRSRIYVTGISGGGRISSMLNICFPDLFTGSVPIVGINYYEKLPTGDGKHWPQSMVKPSANRFKLLRTQRIAAISGPPDFNYAQTALTVDRLKLDGLDARFFNYDDQAHHMPTPARFAEAMSWVDQASTARRAECEDEAVALIETVTKALGDRGPDALTSAMRTRLDRACIIAPWTDASERAAALLGLPRSSD
jgi:hypothetical protein